MNTEGPFDCFLLVLCPSLAKLGEIISRFGALIFPPKSAMSLFILLSVCEYFLRDYGSPHVSIYSTVSSVYLLHMSV